MATNDKLWGKLIYYGIGSFACYAALFMNEKQVLATFTRGDGAYWVLPVITAFVISYFHGGFTGCFWETLGIHAKTPAAPAVVREEVEE